MFRDQLTHFSENTTLLHDFILEGSASTRNDDRQFGRLLLYGSSYLLTCQGTCVYLLDYTRNAVVCYHGNVGPVMDVAICKDEVYVLRKFSHRPLIRLSQQPVFDNMATRKGTVIACNLSSVLLLGSGTDLMLLATYLVVLVRATSSKTPKPSSFQIR